jgi:hypothetical protein
MSSFLRLRLETDPDGTAELFVEVAHAGFSGVGSAWFSVQQLCEFGQRLQHVYPIPQGTSLDLMGGYWNSSAPASLTQKHVGISFYPVGGTGTVGVRVDLQAPLDRDDRPVSRSSVGVELRTLYEPLRLFGAGLVALAQGRLETVALDVNAT